MVALVAAAILAVVVLLAGVGVAHADFSFDSTTIGIGSKQSSQEVSDTSANTSGKLDLPTESISEDSVSTLATPTEKQVVDASEPAASEASAADSSAAASDEQSDSSAASASESTSTSSSESAATGEQSAPSVDSAWSSAVVTWYDDKGGTSAGKNYTYRCAHKTLPFGTLVEISYNSKTITCVVDDRGPYVEGRTFDLNRAAADALGIRSAGVATVSYRIL